ncbi:hypothetical protein Tco_1146524 [Tanacetum coccineum]
MATAPFDVGFFAGNENADPANMGVAEQHQNIARREWDELRSSREWISVENHFIGCDRKIDAIFEKARSMYRDGHLALDIKDELPWERPGVDSKLRLNRKQQAASTTPKAVSSSTKARRTAIAYSVFQLHRTERGQNRMSSSGWSTVCQNWHRLGAIDGTCKPPKAAVLAKAVVEKAVVAPAALAIKLSESWSINPSFVSPASGHLRIDLIGRRVRNEDSGLTAQ